MRHGHKPDCLRKESLTIPLRCPPVVVREVEMAEEIRTGDVLPYVTRLALTAPTDGPRVRVLVHRGHKAIFPEYCVECGRATADVLMNDLHVGVQGVQCEYSNRVHPTSNIMNGWYIANVMELLARIVKTQMSL